MKKNQNHYTKTNIYVDVYGTAHQILHRILKGSTNPDKSIKFLSNDSEIDYYLNALHEEFKNAVSKMAKLSVHNVVLAFDPTGEKSFRHNLFNEYKQSPSRTKERDYCKDGYKTAMIKYFEMLKMAKIKAIKYDLLEADDLLFLLKKHTLDNENIGIISSDGDLKQMIDDRTFVYNNIHNKIHISEFLRRPKTSEFQENADIYGGFFGADLEQVDDMLVRNHDIFFVEATTVNPEHSLLEKILVGDTSDNIKSCFKYKTKNGAKEYGFTEKRFGNLVENGEALSMKVISSEKEYYRFIDIMVAESKTNPRNPEEKRQDYKMLEFNKSLIDLSEGYKQYSQLTNVTRIGEEIEEMLSTPNVPLSRLVIEAPIGIDY